VNDRFFTLVQSPTHLDVYGLDDDGIFARLARTRSWAEASATFGTLPSSRHRHLTLVGAGSRPPESFLHALRPDVDRLVFVPDLWLANLPQNRPDSRARRAARFALAHLFAPIHSRDVFSDYDASL